MTKLLSFHNNPAIKQQTLDNLKEHLRLDEIIKGTGWSNGRGCAVGCTLNEYSHKAYEDELGLPEWLAHLEDVIFENLPDGLHKTFPLEMIEAIPVGVCLEKLKHILSVKRLVPLAQKNPEVHDFIMAVVDLHERTLSGKEVADWEWKEAWLAEAAGSAWAEGSVWPSTSARSAESARSSAARSADLAASIGSAGSAWSAWSAWSVVSVASEWSAHWISERDNLLATLRDLT
jgi:hypothetical protein